ncbi:hypothetical protein RFI_22741 [Reticulomyxa filosa]|uniref:Uncharacterized protein n=1 Tax=Reticulomyxa filosa TaxID=46433 RepID=X6ML82_RETFI|nr:hypothetical protein RFI_22741 [Reticulomyxa filosa]|eukprot:ETO14629.1 hypothetical protein RFI_22741 [Reticulomyxa filosa]
MTKGGTLLLPIITHTNPEKTVRKKKALHLLKMLLIDMEGEEKKAETKREAFSLSSCYNIDWISLTNEPQKLNTLACCLCNQIANNAMELQCNEHETAEHAYLVGEECLQMYLKQNDGKCPIEQHDHCEFSRSKTVRQLVSELLVICPRQYELTKHAQSDEGTKSGERGECEKGNCDYKGKIRDMKDHLDSLCNLNSSKQSDSLDMLDQLNTINEQIKQLQNTTKDLQSQLQSEKLESRKQIEKLKENDNRQHGQIEQLNVSICLFIEQIYNLRRELLEKDQQILEMKQCNIPSKKALRWFEKNQHTHISASPEYNQTMSTNFESQNSNDNTQIEEKKYEEKEKEKRDDDEDDEENNAKKNCESMLSLIKSCDLKNGVDFLLVNENKQIVQLKNNEWNNYNFGIFLLGQNITLTVNCDRTSNNGDLGYLRIKTSGGGGGYGTKGGDGNVLDNGKGGKVYGEDTLLEEIHFGSGGGGGSYPFLIGGSGGGIIELVIEQQLTNHGSIQANGGGGIGCGGGSGGSILIELPSKSSLKQTFGTITCIGGNQWQLNRGGKGRVAIYGIGLLSDDIRHIDPKPFNALHK